ncbi:hypothetical protein [Xylanimonas ulmi]|uniref:Uncharacterized protein n=1 Tax=Xylanimonas ulmi TaxID=228973 RepID=A0A4Q7M5Y7_9MICO|nr:hypothetical protein [Xylanibacterium ulmi]RZS62463.1 hypothetical protein EV386_2796 [Xylanibacterium ulmi]
MGFEVDPRCEVCGRLGQTWAVFSADLCDRHAVEAFDRTGWADDGLYLAQVTGPWVADERYDVPGPQPGGAHLLTSPAPADVHVGLTVPCVAQTGDVVMVRYVWVERQRDPYDDAGHTSHLYYRAEPVGPLPPAVAAVYEPEAASIDPDVEVFHEGEWVAVVGTIPSVVGTGATRDEAISNLVSAARQCAFDWNDHLRHAPNHAGNRGFVQVVTCRDDDALRDWLTGRAQMADGSEHSNDPLP